MAAFSRTLGPTPHDKGESLRPYNPESLQPKSSKPFAEEEENLAALLEAYQEGGEAGLEKALDRLYPAADLISETVKTPIGKIHVTRLADHVAAKNVFPLERPPST
jgi:hypothetical protein